ncbi:MAG: hypothetical protein L3J84_10535 [Gammaproteobacteria bacterium]|nr:hypothetical protein [Gammaproteobacteria bacterium]
MPKEITRQWLAGAANSAAQKYPDLHMGIILNSLALYGMPKFDNTDYDAWSNLIKNIVYKGLKLISVADSHRPLKTLESVAGTILPGAEVTNDNFLS